MIMFPPIRGYSGYETVTEAQAFISTATITDPTEQYALNWIVKYFQDNGLWTLIKALYPVVGGDSTKGSWNLKDTSQFRLTYTSTPSFSSMGMDFDGAANFANTNLNPSTVLTANSCHLLYYSRESDSGSIWDMGAQTSATTTQRLAMALQFGSQMTVNMYDNSTSGLSPLNTDGTGCFISTRTASNAVAAYRNKVSKATNAGAAGTQPNANILIGAVSNGAAVLNFGKLQCAGAQIGDGLNSTQANLMTDGWQQFNTILRRQVVLN